MNSCKPQYLINSIKLNVEFKLLWIGFRFIASCLQHFFQYLYSLIIFFADFIRLPRFSNTSDALSFEIVANRKTFDILDVLVINRKNSVYKSVQLNI